MSFVYFHSASIVTAILLLLLACPIRALTTPKPASSSVSTPCVRICRYNADFYNGAVCIGCFRETFEISQWTSMSRYEKYFTLQDAADRWQPGYEGSITKEELLRQAQAFSRSEQTEE